MASVLSEFIFCERISFLFAPLVMGHKEYRIAYIVLTRFITLVTLD